MEQISTARAEEQRQPQYDQQKIMQIVKQTMANQQYTVQNQQEKTMITHVEKKKGQQGYHQESEHRDNDTLGYQINNPREIRNKSISHKELETEKTKQATREGNQPGEHREYKQCDNTTGDDHIARIIQRLEER